MKGSPQRVLWLYEQMKKHASTVTCAYRLVTHSALSLSSTATCQFSKWSSKNRQVLCHWTFSTVVIWTVKRIRTQRLVCLMTANRKACQKTMVFAEVIYVHIHDKYDAAHTHVNTQTPTEEHVLCMFIMGLFNIRTDWMNLLKKLFSFIVHYEHIFLFVWELFVG